MTKQPLQIVTLFAFSLSVQAGLRQECVEPTPSTYEMSLPSFHKKIKVPPVSSNLHDFRYATENAVVALPASCAQEYRALVDGVEIEDTDHKGMLLFRRSGSQGDLSDLMKCSSSANGLVVVLPGHRGSIGAGAPQLYMRILSGLGFVAVALDGGADRTGMKGEEFATLKGQQGGSKDVDLYSNKCTDFSKPFCYTTATENILNNKTQYKQFMERVHLIRKHELDYFVEAALVPDANGKSLLDAFHSNGKKIFLLGRSDGGVFVSQYYHKKLYSDFLDGIVIGAFSCDFTYMNSCAKHVQICQDQCTQTMPLLAWISDIDPYFSNADGSVASKVARSSDGYGGEITGNCKAAFDAQEFSSASTVLLKGSAHDESGMYEDTIRRLLTDFTSSPRDHLKPPSGCTVEGNLYHCQSTKAENLSAEFLGRSNPSKKNVSASVSMSVKVAVDVQPHGP